MESYGHPSSVIPNTNSYNSSVARIGMWQDKWTTVIRVVTHHLSLGGNVPITDAHIKSHWGRTPFSRRHFEMDFPEWNVWFSIKISLKFVPRGLFNNNPALGQIMSWRRPGDKPLYEPIMISLLTHICVTRPQWVKIQPIRHGYGLMSTGTVLLCRVHP